MARFEIIDDRTVMDADGVNHDVFEAIERLPWVDQLCPLMPPQYAPLSKSAPRANRVVAHMQKAANPDTYRAYFRGYHSPNRSGDAPDGQRSWLTRMMINRCRPDSVEPPRLVSEGARPVLDDRTGPAFDLVFGARFADPGTATWYAQRAETVFRVESR